MVEQHLKPRSFETGQPIKLNSFGISEDTDNGTVTAYEEGFPQRRFPNDQCKFGKRRPLLCGKFGVS
jgi:hypothetical protein